MEKIRSLADQLREELVKEPGEEKGALKRPGKVPRRSGTPNPGQALIDALNEHDNSDHRSLIHVRFDRRTVDTLNRFKMASNIDVTKVVAFAMKEFLEKHPEVKSVIKHFIENAEL